MTDVASPLKLKWMNNTLGARRQFDAFDPPNTGQTAVCLVRYCWEAEHLGWYWSANHPLGSDTRVIAMREPRQGHAATKMEAAYLAEEAHGRFLKAIDEMGWREKLKEWGYYDGAYHR